ncbi:CGNR zinc finger domain-containing protein [Streptomyces sp. NPDC051561]|uniref:CGNR zinc finger domain-containing protein n=1 Tax=Streptomyces sp. NPDC051561 TaxID=3365658 RepID=UPI0037BE083A
MTSQQPVFVGGHPVLDFVNTVAWRTDGTRRTDRVTGGPDGWLKWARDAGLRGGAGEVAGVGKGRDAGKAPEPAALLRLRTALGRILDAYVEGAPLPADAWGGFRHAVLEARTRAALPAALPLRWNPAGAGLVHELALGAEELLADPAAVQRIGRCAAPGCGWFYLDRTRSRSRRWCSSGDCGNRDRARRHYARTRPPGETHT